MVNQATTTNSHTVIVKKLVERHLKIQELWVELIKDSQIVDQSNS